MSSHNLAVRENYDHKDGLPIMLRPPEIGRFTNRKLPERDLLRVGSSVGPRLEGVPRPTNPEPPPAQAKARSDRSSWKLREQEQQLASLLAGKRGKAKSATLARSLIDHFGSLPAILSASPYRQRKFPGMTDGLVSQLQKAFALAEMMALERIPEHQPILHSWQTVLEYLHVKLAYQPVENFRILFLDTKNRLMLDELQQLGTVGQVFVSPREVVKRALELCASGLILVHNHPSGDPSPSSADVKMTQDIIVAAKGLGIVVHDHLIIARSGHASMRSLKLL